MNQDNPKYNLRFQAPPQGFAVGDRNIITNYFGHREEIIAESVEPINENLSCPYRGLLPFEPEDAELFFGREVFVDELYLATQTRNFISVLGASGSGKSSVVLAGLVSKLQQEDHWQFTHFRPGSEPFLALAQALVPLYEPDLDSTDRMCQARKLAQNLGDGSIPLRDVFTQIEHEYPNHKVLLIADQFEELYTLCREQTTRLRFLDLLLDSFGTNPQELKFPPTLVTTMRTDFLGNALAYRPFADILQDSDIKLGAMNREELSQVISQPANTLGVTLEDGLVERILTDVEDEPGNLALLEFALTELWRERKGNKLTHQGYEKIGQVKGALAKYAEKKYLQLGEAEQKQAQQIFMQLVHLGEEKNDTRRRVNRNQLGETNWQLVTRKHGLADSRLVVTSLAEDKERETIEIVHEALIGHWQRLRQWIDESREQLKQQHKLEDEAKQWQDSGYKIDYLSSKKRLKEAKEFQQEQQEQYPLSELANKFIDKSIIYRRNSRLRLIGFGLIPMLFVAIFVGLFSYRGIRIHQLRNVLNEAQEKKDDNAIYNSLEDLVWFRAPLNKIKLENSQLDAVNLKGADLEAANLMNASLIISDLSDANLSLTNFEGAKLMGAYLYDSNFLLASLSGANLEGAKLMDANLSRAKLMFANLKDAHLDRAFLIFAELGAAELPGADFKGANLVGADLSLTNLKDADLEGADLGCLDHPFSGEERCADFRLAVHLTPEQVKKAKNWQLAIYDPEFRSKLGLPPETRTIRKLYE